MAVGMRGSRAPESGASGTMLLPSNQSELGTLANMRCENLSQTRSVAGRLSSVMESRAAPVATGRSRRRRLLDKLGSSESLVTLAMEANSPGFSVCKWTVTVAEPPAGIGPNEATRPPPERPADPEVEVAERKEELAGRVCVSTTCLAVV